MWYSQLYVRTYLSSTMALSVEDLGGHFSKASGTDTGPGLQLAASATIVKASNFMGDITLVESGD